MRLPRPVPRSAALVVLLLLPLALAAQSGVRAPEQAFGMRPGADRALADWTQVTKYFSELAASSPKVKLVPYGTTSMGRPMIAAAISAPDNLARLADIRAGIARLGDPRQTAASDVERLVLTARPVVAIGCSIHASELGAAQMAPELAYYLATDASPETARILDSVVLLLIPSLNPDGMDLVVDWYRQSVGKPWEGAEMPWLYNKYTGHDINRDFFMLTQVENRHLAALLYDWRPQAYLSMHQMGANGPRIFVPPLVDPIDPNYEPLIWREMALLGHGMALTLQSAGMKGVVTNAMYDYYIPGYDDSGPLGHNTVCLLSEVASARLATPLTIPRESLRGGSKGLPDYAVQQNFPDPWNGGTWGLRDIVDYDKQAALGLLGAAARYGDELLRNYYAMARNQVEKGKSEPPFAYVIPAEQRDPLTAAKMVDILRMAAVEVWQAKGGFHAAGRTCAAGSYVVRMDQPNRAYAKTLLEKQVYPAPKAAPGAAPERPYDVTAWTLPYQMGVDAFPVERAFPFDGNLVDRARVPAQVPNVKGAALVVGAEMNDAFTLVNRILRDGGRVLRATRDVDTKSGRVAAGSFVLPIDRPRAAKLADYFTTLPLPARTLAALPPSGTIALAPSRVALYRPWSANADEGWTRWLLEQYEFPFTTIRDVDLRAGKLSDRFDVIILPSMRGNALVDGNRAGSLPPEYTGGAGNEGVASLRAFVEAGGTLIPLGGSARFAIDRFNLPVRDALQGLKPDAFFCPGSILRTVVDPAQPIAWGMPAESIAFFQQGSAFELTPSLGGAEPKPIVRYAGQQILMSGWIQGEAQLANRVAAAEVPLGRGRVVLFGFGVQNRAEPHATFKLLFNALMLPRDAKR
ncbi:MAG: M14 metallopeptidase family protein [Bacteroidales bacterium]